MNQNFRASSNSRLNQRLGIFVILLFVMPLTLAANFAQAKTETILRFQTGQEFHFDRDTKDFSVKTPENKLVHLRYGSLLGSTKLPPDSFTNYVQKETMVFNLKLHHHVISVGTEVLYLTDQGQAWSLGEGKLSETGIVQTEAVLDKSGHAFIRFTDSSNKDRLFFIDAFNAYEIELPSRSTGLVFKSSTPWDLTHFKYENGNITYAPPDVYDSWREIDWLPKARKLSDNVGFDSNGAIFHLKDLGQRVPKQAHTQGTQTPQTNLAPVAAPHSPAQTKGAAPASVPSTVAAPAPAKTQATVGRLHYQAGATAEENGFTNGDGKVYRVPVEGKVASSDAVFLEYGNEKLLLGTVAGERGAGTYLVRASDGLVVKVSVLFAEVKNFKVENGILSIPGQPRMIDLDALAEESRFVPRGPGTTADKTLKEQGEEKKDSPQKNPIEWVDTFFEDLRASGDGSIELTPKDEELVKKIEENLRRRQRASTVVLGGAGSGKTTLVKSAVRRLPRTWRVPILEASSLGAGASYKGMFEGRIDSMLAASAAVPILWFADEVHALKGSGSHSNSSNDFFEMVKRPLAEGGMMMIATDTPTEYYEKITDPAIHRRLTPIELTEPTPEEVFLKMRLWIKKQKYAQPSDDVLKEVMELSADFNIAENEPSRSVGLLEAIYAKLEIENRLSQAPGLEDAGKAAESLYRLDPALRDRAAMRLRIQQLPEALDRRIIGQTHVKDALISLSKRALAGLHDGRGPRLSMLIDGPPGTGKTELAIAYAEAMRLPWKRLEMNRFDGVNLTVEDLMTEIAKEARTNSFTVFIPDEFEKAPPKVQEAFLTMMASENGKFTAYTRDIPGGPKRATTVSVKNASFIMTSNAASDWIQSFMASLTPEQRDMPRSKLIELIDKKGLKQAQLRKISEPLLTRVKYVGAALPPNSTELREILNLHLKGRSSFISAGLKADVDFDGVEDFIEELVEKTFRESLTPREIIEVMRDGVEGRAAEIVMHEDFREKERYQLNLRTGAVVRSCEAVFMKKQ